MQGEGADAERGQFDGVQQGDLGHAVCFCAPAGPVLVTLNLGVEDRVGQRSSVIIKSLSVYGGSDRRGMKSSGITCAITF